MSIFNIQKHKLVTGIIQSTQQPEFRQDIVEKRTREVIKKNMETVQKIAFLLVKLPKSNGSENEVKRGENSKDD